MTHTKPRTQARCLRPSRPATLATLCGAAALLVATGSALAADAKPSAAHALANRHGCMGCHAVDAQLVGPAYQAVAERYRDKAGAEVELAQHIRAGGSGRWGAMAMPPQAQLSESDARKLAAWVLNGAK